MPMSTGPAPGGQAAVRRGKYIRPEIGIRAQSIDIDDNFDGAALNEPFRRPGIMHAGNPGVTVVRVTQLIRSEL